jgi:CRP-like cAMP-binding protein
MINIKELTAAIVPYFQKEGLKITYKKGHQFFRPEDSAQGIYYLESGQAFIYANKSRGEEQILAIGEVGTIFGKVGSVVSQPSISILAQSLTECKVIRLGCQQFQQLIETKPDAFRAYMNQVSRNNVYLLSQALIVGEKDVYSRVIGELMFLAEFHGDNVGEGRKLRVSLNQEQLANMLCISREYLNKTLKKISMKKLIIDVDGFWEIPNLKALQDEIEAD